MDTGVGKKCHRIKLVVFMSILLEKQYFVNGSRIYVDIITGEKLSI